MLAIGIVGGVAVATTAIELMHRPHLALPTALAAASERLVGVSSIHLPRHLNAFLTPTLGALGALVAITAVVMVLRPTIVRRRTNGELERARTSSVATGWARSTTSPCATTSSGSSTATRWSPTPSTAGCASSPPTRSVPSTSGEETWGAFRAFAEQRGWTVGLIGAGESWLPLYAAAGMRYLYLGDEAVVDVPAFSLAGGKMKGLRQACTRARAPRLHDRVPRPRHDRPRAASAAIVSMMQLNRRGDDERGFSMCLGRLFDPKDQGLLLAVATSPEGEPAAMCQFVPSPAVAGYSLDLMRRDPGDHPNGLLDYVLCSTIEHLAAQGAKGLSLNFAAFRSILDGERGEGVTTRTERWALKRLSGIMPIESLWRFNAKYEPAWLPRYLVYPAAESFVPVVVATLRAESITELPVIGRFLANDPANREPVPSAR